MAGTKVTETEKANYLINTFPESMNYLGDLVDFLKDDENENVFEYLKYKILVKAKSIGIQVFSDNGVNSQVFAANSSGRPGSISFNFTSFKCVKVSHWRFECFGSSNGKSNHLSTHIESIFF